MTDPILKITDGDIEFDLLNDTYGLSLNSWRQQLINFKNGGTYRDNPLADQRRLVDTKWSNAIETLTVKDKNVDVNTLIEVTQNLLRLLEKAVDYWTTDWQNTPVFLVARAACETNARYALIVNYRLPDLPSPYEQPFLQPGGEPVWDDYDIILEREHWTKNQPGTGTAVPISATEDYNGVSLGNVDSDGDRETVTGSRAMYVTNKRTTANVTHIFRDDGGVFSGNLLGGGVPFNLLPAAAIAVGDAVYFGCSSAISNSGPINNLIFDIGTTGAGYTGVWETWQAVAWGAPDAQDNTNNDGLTGGIAFDTAGVRGVFLKPQPHDATTSVNGVTGYWIRYRITGAPGGYTSPTQQNRDVYSAIWPYVEVQAADIGGDIPSKIRLTLTNESQGVNPNLEDGAAERIVMGLRSYSRGANFTAFLNASDDQNPSGVTVSAGADSAIENDTFESPTGRRIRFTSTGTTEVVRATWALDDTISTDFYGRFRAFARVTLQTGTLGDVLIRMVVDMLNGGSTVVSVENKQVVASDDMKIFDLGIVNIPPISQLSTAYIIDNLRLRITAQANAAGKVLYIYDLILIPVDEWSGDFTPNQTWGRDNVDADTTEYMDIDSISIPKNSPLALIRRLDDDNVVDLAQRVTTGDIILQANSRQRLWVVAFNRSALEDWPVISHSVQVTANQRYLNMRGER